MAAALTKQRRNETTHARVARHGSPGGRGSSQQADDLNRPAASWRQPTHTFGHELPVPHQQRMSPSGVGAARRTGVGTGASTRKPRSPAPFSPPGPIARRVS